MQKTYLSEDVIRVVMIDVNGFPVTKILHNRDAKELVEKTKAGDTQREFFCPRCKKTFYTPL